MAPRVNSELLLVGSLPADSADQALRAAAGFFGDVVFALPDGETGPRSAWVGYERERLVRPNPGVVVVQETESPTGIPRHAYETPVFGIRPGVTELHWDSWPRIDDAIAGYRVFSALRAEGVIPARLRRGSRTRAQAGHGIALPVRLRRVDVLRFRPPAGRGRDADHAGTRAGGPHGQKNDLDGRDLATGDPGRDNPNEQFPLAAWPGLDARLQGGLAFVLGHMVRRPLDQHAPALPPGRVDVVDLERDLVVPAGDPGLQVFVERTVRNGAEHDRPVVPFVVHRQYHRAEPAVVSDPADSAPRYQPEALGLVKFRDRAVRHVWSFPSAGLSPSHDRSAGRPHRETRVRPESPG